MQNWRIFHLSKALLQTCFFFPHINPDHHYTVWWLREWKDLSLSFFNNTYNSFAFTLGLLFI